MEEEKKVPTVSEPNPNGDDEIKASDLKGETPKAEGDPADDGEKGDPKGEGKKPEDGNPEPAKQDRATDAENAERRRKQREREKEREAQKQRESEERIRRQAVFDVKKGLVTADELRELSLTDVKDEDQLFLVESLRKAKAEGAENPVADAYMSLYRKQESDKAAAQAKAETERKAEEARKAVVAKDQQAFKAKFGKTTAEVMKNETEFMELFGDLIDQEKGNFTALYSAYTAMKKTNPDAAKREGAFPTDSKGTSSSPSGAVETDEEFLARFKAQYGR